MQIPIFATNDPAVVSDLAAGLRLLEERMKVDGGLHPATRQAMRELKAFIRTSESTRTPNGTSITIRPTLSTMEAAGVLGCGVRNVQALVQRGTLQGRVVRGVLRVDAESVESQRRGA
jgi:hypothetical protein